MSAVCAYCGDLLTGVVWLEFNEGQAAYVCGYCKEENDALA